MGKLTSRLVLPLAAAVLLILVSAGNSAPAQTVRTTPTQRALLATVRLTVPIAGSRTGEQSTGSGAVLTDNGLILTNFHVIGDPKTGVLFNQEGPIYVSVNPPGRGAPILRYKALYKTSDLAFDLALVEITGYVNSDEPLPESLGLTWLEPGDSDLVNTGDELGVVGFPAIGGNSVTFTRGQVAGFLDDDENGVWEWIKTDAQVHHGSSGGPVINAAGEMIGILTAAPQGAIGQIGLVRPINLAQPLITIPAIDASRQKSADCQSIQRHPEGAAVSRLVFSEAVDRQGRSIEADAAFQSGLPAVYAVFDYSRFRAGRQLRFTWSLNGERIADASDPWSGARAGREWTVLYDEARLADGLYRLDVRYDGRLLACRHFIVGDTDKIDAIAPTFGPITFAAEEQNGRPLDPATQFPPGVNRIVAFFDYADMANGATWRQLWCVDGLTGVDVSNVWTAGQQGSHWIEINAEGGLPGGDYELELYVEGEFVQSGRFTIDATPPPVSSDAGIPLIGRVVDANRASRPVAQALVIFLTPGVSIDRWLNTPFEADLHAIATTDENGQFQLSGLVQRGQTYPVVVLAGGYRQLTEPNYPIPADASVPFAMEDIRMTRR